MTVPPIRLGRVARGLLAAALLLTGRGVALGQGTLDWVEVGLVLDGAGRARVSYQCRWRTSGTMHGFYFQGEAATPRFREGHAELPDGRRVPLSITPAGARRWDIVLADGQAWGPGAATYSFSYDVDLAAAGMIDLTESAEGDRLVVLSWAPVEWDEALSHETLVVIFTSVPAPRSGELTLEDAAAAGLRTERWVNERYLITYRGEGDPSVLWVRFHQDDVAARQDHRVQIYLPADNFPGVTVAAERRRAAAAVAAQRRQAAARERVWRRVFYVLPLLLGLALVTLGITARKLKGLARAYATAPDVLWERDDWEPPRLRLQTFRKPGKVAELTDLEALALLGLPFQVLLAMVLDALAARGRLRRETRDGALWLAHQGEAPPEGEPYQGFVWEALGDALAPAPEGLAGRLGEVLVGTVQRKAWDADLDATRKHYRHLFEEMFPDAGAVAGRTFGTPEDYGHYFPWWVSHHHSSGAGVWRSDAPAGPAPFEGGGGSFGGAGATAHFADVDLAALGPAPERASMAAFAPDDLVTAY
ncbi:MAG: hypothetical protein PVJ73_00330, partial [Acidobacteriota bacterium]